VFLLAALVIAVVWSSFHKTELVRVLDVFLTYCGRLGWRAPVLLNVATAVMTVTMLPTFPLMVGAGTIMPKIFGEFCGEAIGVASVFVGLWLGSMLAFLLGRTLLRDWARQKLEKFAWMRAINAVVESDGGWWFVLLARATPILPAELFNYACSLTSLSTKNYAVGCLGSMLPVCFWVCSTASAVQAVQDETAGHKAARLARSHPALIVANLAAVAAVCATVGFAMWRARGIARRSDAESPLLAVM
jgi:uncharacterized membrane protein YdjX (TVP38/TMEM64 family)